MAMLNAPSVRYVSGVGAARYPPVAGPNRADVLARATPTAAHHVQAGRLHTRALCVLPRVVPGGDLREVALVDRRHERRALAARGGRRGPRGYRGRRDRRRDE